MTSFWHPFADMAAVEVGGGPSIVRGRGSHIWDEAGNRYLDSTAGLWFCNVGHGRAEIAEAARRQMAELASYSTFGDLTNPPTEALAERVAGLAPMPSAKVFLTSGGSDSIDSATKIVRRYWSLVGEPDRTVLIRRERAYHGMHAAGTRSRGSPRTWRDTVRCCRTWSRSRGTTRTRSGPRSTGSARAESPRSSANP
jgi:Adenosylmethionine-8-amino-7-oxononanoate aminotransferase